MDYTLKKKKTRKKNTKQSEPAALPVQQDYLAQHRSTMPTNVTNAL